MFIYSIVCGFFMVANAQNLQDITTGKFVECLCPYLNDTSIKSIKHYDVSKEVKFILYTSSSDTGLHLNTYESFKFIDITKPTKFLIHGWKPQKDTYMNIKKAYLTHFLYNVIVVDWSGIANNLFYPIAAFYTKYIGEYLGMFLDNLVSIGMKDDKMHLIGYCLGAHVSGIAGRVFKKGRVARITGLDPTKPCFEPIQHYPGLSKDDAKFVDIIHTCSGDFGIESAIGHMDFYPNNGQCDQPGCENIQCSHMRSWHLFEKSIDRRKRYFSCRCEDWAAFESKNCTLPPVLMGDPVPITGAHGNYYLRTNSSNPVDVISNKCYCALCP